MNPSAIYEHDMKAGTLEPVREARSTSFADFIDWDREAFRNGPASSCFKENVRTDNQEAALGFESDINGDERFEGMPFSPTEREDLRCVDDDLLQAVAHRVSVLSPPGSVYIRHATSSATSLGFDLARHPLSPENPPLLLPGSSWNSAVDFSLSPSGFSEDFLSGIDPDGDVFSGPAVLSANARYEDHPVNSLIVDQNSGFLAATSRSESVGLESPPGIPHPDTWSSPSVPAAMRLPPVNSCDDTMTIRGSPPVSRRHSPIFAEDSCQADSLDTNVSRPNCSSSGDLPSSSDNIRIGRRIVDILAASVSSSSMRLSASLSGPIVNKLSITSLFCDQPFPIAKQPKALGSFHTLCAMSSKPVSDSGRVPPTTISELLPHSYIEFLA